MRAEPEANDQAEDDSERQRSRKGPRGLRHVAPEGFGPQQLCEIAESRERRRDGLWARDLKQNLPSGEQRRDQDQTVDGRQPRSWQPEIGELGSCAHARLRLRMSSCSQWDSVALTTTETARINKISGYMT